MPSNSSSYLRPIMQWEEYPAFSEVRELVNGYQAKEPVWSDLTPLAMEGLLLLMLLLAVVAPYSSMQRVQQPMKSIARGILSQSSSAAVRFEERMANPSSSISNTRSNGLKLRVDTITAKSSDTGTASHLSSLEAMPALLANPQIVAVNSLPKPFPNHSEPLGAWSAFVSTGSALETAIPMAWTGGVRYRLSNELNLVAEMRSTSLSRIASIQTTVYRDTTVTVSGQQYKNTFTTNSTQNIAIGHPVCLVAGARWEFLPMDALTPFAEMVAGGSLSGFLNSIDAGMRWEYSEAAGLDLDTRLDRFLSPRFSPTNSLSIEATLSYRW